jgi:superfamily II RNA helicase
MTVLPDEHPLGRRVPHRDATDDAILERFLEFVAERGLELYPAQEEALLEIVAGKNVILSTPTGSGKSLVAAALHFAAMARGKRSVYTAPIKALVNEKFFALCRDFGPENVGMLTGDAAVNRGAPILCCTAEILANVALREGAAADVDAVVMDEFHYYADRDRGVAWQVPLLSLPQASFLLMSATLGPVDFFEKALTSLNGRPTAVVRSTHRPVPLDFEYRETPLHETVANLVQHGRAPIYVVAFTQRSAAEEAQNLMSTDFCTKEEKRAIADALVGVKFTSPYGKEVQRFVRHGIGLHHAGLLPKYRLLVEKLAQKGLLKVICGTDTLGVGVNIPIRTVLFTKLCKFDGEKTAILAVRDFQQISGRAGRKGFDDRGTVVVQAPEHVIENLRLEAKAGGDPAKKKKIVRKKPPEKGYVHWDKATFERLTTALPEPLVSRFAVSHGMLLNVLSRPSGGCGAMKHLIKASHDTKHQKKQHVRTAFAMFKSLLGAGIVYETFDDETGARRYKIDAELQEDFSLNHALSLYLVDTIEKLRRDENPEYAVDLLSIVEAILENPSLLLERQLDKLKTEKLAELKAAGVEYEERVAALEKMDYPKPNAEFIYATFNEFAKVHPWVGQENIRPKGVAREMYESYAAFGELVREYGLERAEGLLLRYLSDVYKTLVQSVPEVDRTDDVDEMIAYFRGLVRGVDSSLIDEWESMRGGRGRAEREEAEPEREVAPADVTTDTKAFTVLVRNEVFRLLRALSQRDFAGAAEIVAEGGEPWTADAIEAALAPFWEEHSAIRTDPKARVPGNTRVEAGEARWTVQQIVLDPEGHDDWVVEVAIDLDRARAAGKPLLALARIGA